MRGAWIALGLGAGALGSACVPLGAFQCESDAMCVRNGLPGVCQPSEYCSYDDDICESGQRYGDYAGDGLAGQCVEEEPGTTSGTTDPTTSDDGQSESGGSTGSAVGSTGSDEDTGTSTGEPEPMCGRPPDPCWVILHDEPVGASQRGYGIALGPEDGWAVAGNVASDPEHLDDDAWVLRWGDDRELRWAVPVAETPDAMDVGRNVTFADDGTVAAIGNRADMAMAFVTTLDPEGKETGYFEFGTGDNSQGWDLAYDGADLRVVGTVGDGLGGRDGWIARYALDGTELWSDPLMGPLDDDGRGLVMGSDGQFYVIGSTYEDETTRRWFMRSYLDEVQQWEERHGNNWNVGRSVSLGGTDDPAFVGSSLGGLYVSRRDPTGMELWNDDFSTSDSGTHGGEDVVVDGAGNVIVVGWLSVEGQGSDAFVRKYDPDGNTQWTAWYDADGGADRANGVVVDSQDRVIVVGYAQNEAGDDDLWLAMYPP